MVRVVGVHGQRCSPRRVRGVEEVRAVTLLVLCQRVLIDPSFPGTQSKCVNINVFASKS